MSEETPTYGTPGAIAPEPAEPSSSTPAAERRLIQTNITADLLSLMLSGKWRAVATDAPEDLTVVGASISLEDRRDGRIQLLCASASFEPVPEGCDPPARHFRYMGTKSGGPIARPEPMV